MSKNKEFEKQVESFNEAMVEMAKHRDEILKAFGKAYLAETQINPSEVELVTRQMPEKDGVIEHVYFFRRKNEEKGE